MTKRNPAHVPSTKIEFVKVKARPLPDELTIAIKVDGELVEVGRRYRDRDGTLRVAWEVPASQIEHEIFYLSC